MKTRYELLVNCPDGKENPYMKYRVAFYRDGTQVGSEDIPRSLKDLENSLITLLDKFKDSPRQVSLKISI